MGSNTRKRRSSMATKAVAASAALALGGGGLIWANFYASAHESNNGAQNQTKAANAQVATIQCPDVGQKLSDVPDGARAGVDEELANLDKQITEAYTRLASTRQAQAGDSGFVNNAILGPLKSKRTAVIDRIGIDIRRMGGNAPGNLAQLAECQGMAVEQPQTNAGGQNQGQNQGRNQGQNEGDNGNGAAGPAANDFVDINQVQPNVPGPAERAGRQRGRWFHRHLHHQMRCQREQPVQQ